MRTKLLTAAVISALAMTGFAAAAEEQPGPPVPGNPASSAVPEREIPRPREFPAELQSQTVLPEVSTAVTMSSSDINRICCDGDIRDVIFSRDKDLSVKTVGRDAFVKFRIARQADREVHSSTPTELFVVCGENVYNLIALPKRVPSQTVRLSPGNGKIRSNRSLYASLPYEKKLLGIIRSVYTNEIPESFTTTSPGSKLSLFRDMELSLARSHRVDGEGLLVKEYVVMSSVHDGELKLSEKDFLIPALATRAAAISLDRHRLKRGDTARLIIVEQETGNGGGGGHGLEQD